MAASPDQPSPSLSEVTPSLYSSLTGLQRRLTEKAYARIVAGKTGIYTGPLDTSRRRAQLAYTYGFYAYARTTALPLAAATGILFAITNPITLSCGAVSLVATVLEIIRLWRRSNRNNEYFRREAP